MRTLAKRTLIALAVIIVLILIDAGIGRIFFDQTPEPELVFRKSATPTNRLIIVFPGAYAPGQELFKRITATDGRADIAFVENRRSGYDEATTARIVNDELRERPEYTQVTIISLSMGTGAALDFMGRLYSDGREARDVKWIPIAPPMNKEQLTDTGARLAAHLGWIGPGLNLVLQPAMNQFVFATPEPGLGADEESVGHWSTQVRERFTARAVAHQAAAAARTKVFDAHFTRWFQDVVIAFPLVELDPVVNNRAAYETLEKIHPGNMTMRVYFEDQKWHCSLPENPDAWNKALAELLDDVGFSRVA